jgi:3-hydroxyacyl-[acyl-carrier-protein] dehydratase
MAQACGHLILATVRYKVMPFLMEVRHAKMRNFVTPGAELVITAKLDHLGSGFAVAHASVTHEGKRVTEAEIRFRTMPFPSDAMKDVMLDLVEGLGLPRPVLAEAQAGGA